MAASDDYNSDDGLEPTAASADHTSMQPAADGSFEQIPDNIDDSKVDGTVLEAAFVDPAYQWPPPDGQGRNAIELKASQSLIADLDDPTKEFDKETQTFVKKKAKPGQQGIRTTKTVVENQSYRGFWCCKWNVKNQVSENIKEDRFQVDENGNMIDIQESASADAVVEQAPEPTPAPDAKEERRKSRYGKVPEGILIYRLNTTTRRLELLSEPHTNTDLNSLVRDMVIASAAPSNDKSRRGMDLVGEDGIRTTLVACEQRTAIAWLEVLDMILATKNVSLSQFRL